MLEEASMDVSSNMVGMVKTNAKVLCKETIENPKKNFPGGSYLVLKINSTANKDRMIIAIG